MSYIVGFVRPRSLSIVGVTDSLVSVVRQSPLSSLHVRNRKRGVFESSLSIASRRIESLALACAKSVVDVVPPTAAR
jgi:hypothetical protein